MACGSLYKSGPQKLRHSLTALDFNSDSSSQEVPSRNMIQASAYTTKNKNYSVQSRSGQDAIRFLQAEHEVVLSGLHRQIQTLQERCDDLQFEAHLRHVSEKDESSLKKRVEDLLEKLQEKEAVISDLHETLNKKEEHLKDLTEQHRWRELQLKQQIQVGEQKIEHLKEECSQLTIKVRDLRVYSAALRRGNDKVGSNAAGTAMSRSNSRVSVVADNENVSHDSSNHDNDDLDTSNSWQMARYVNFNVNRRIRRSSGTSVDKPTRLHNQQSQQPVEMISLMDARPFYDHSQSLNASFDFSGADTPAKLRRGGRSDMRPGSSSIILPPINLNQSVTKPQFRQFMRFSSAPPTDVNSRRRLSDMTDLRRAKFK